MSEQIKIGRGKLRRVNLGDLPENEAIFNRIDELDFAVRFELSPELPNGKTAVRYMDCIIWMKPDVALTSDDVIGLSANWKGQIHTLSIDIRGIDISTQLSLAEYQNSMNGSYNASVSKALQGESKAIIDMVDFNTERYIAQTADIRLYSLAGGMVNAILVSVTEDRRRLRPLDSVDCFEPVIGTLFQLPRETLSQGELSIIKVAEPMSKVGPMGFRVIISGTVAGCSAIVVVSDESEVISNGYYCKRILPELNERWREVYSRATIPREAFLRLEKDFHFKLKREYCEVSESNFEELMYTVGELDIVDWKYPTIKFNPRRPPKVNVTGQAKMLFKDLTEEQRTEVTNNLVDYLPTVDWPTDGSDVDINASFGVVAITHVEWEQMLNQFDPM